MDMPKVDFNGTETALFLLQISLQAGSASSEVTLSAHKSLFVDLNLFLEQGLKCICTRAKDYHKTPLLRRPRGLDFYRGGQAGNCGCAFYDLRLCGL